MTTKAKFIFLPKEHEGGLDKDGGEAGEVSSLNQPQKRHEPTMMSVVTKWPNLKCDVGHMTHFDQFLDQTLVEDLFKG